MNPTQLEPSSSPASALALSNNEEGMEHNVESAQELQEDFSSVKGPHYTRSWQKCKPFRAKEALLSDIIEEEMAPQTQVSVLSHLHHQQAKEIKSHSDEMRCLSPMMEKQHAILERVQEQQSRIPKMPIPHPTSHIEELQREAFNILPGTVNAR